MRATGCEPSEPLTEYLLVLLDLELHEFRSLPELAQV